jgi:YwiC-like protein
MKKVAAKVEFGEGAAVVKRAPSQSSGGGVRLRTVALPVEHGGWRISLEPVVLGLLVAPSATGLALGVATLGAFLARHPFKIVAGDRRRGRRFARTPAAERFTLLYGAVALAGFVWALASARGYSFLLPLAFAVGR